MPKRKRDDANDGLSTRATSQLGAQQLARFRGLVEQSQKSLVSALRLARGFERQKMGRRQKNANKDPKTLLQRREELIVLKQLDLSNIAKNHMVKTYMKSKRIRESAAFVVVYGQQPKLDTVTAVEGVVIGRLFNSQPVKVAVSKIMADAYEVLGLQNPADGKSKAKAPSTDADVKSSNTAVPELDPMDITEDEEQSADDRPLVASDDDISGSDDGLERHQDRSVPSGASMSFSSEESDEDDRQPRTSARTAKRRAARPSVSPPPMTAQTAFLPSLSMGGYYSGSDSSEDDAETRGPAQAKDRKNRRGQRARQQLAELKYGTNAKHLQKTDKSSTRDAGWDKRKGAVGPGSDGKRRSKLGKPLHGNPARDKTSSISMQAKTQTKPKRDDSGPLHPSWEAAKQRKMQSAAPPAFAGKKITFD
ncbi:uncharacterized protein HMPREF1541_05406 [Cyphellophora europaea CBS 101466]|uniref:Bud22 domain-containing protein n=1 Tax=Cyphellophora europaea (strain CBS 101466) TaxID=1220924 RepID=W2RTU3_CYPE1|nr:uncharacterized protein HMPREF1541_05406 [Cyphellophora europaea CBS 101466]ETN39183.1 hypothetical protein HMPREF1541_05406 [Cyphellophora europaea CBS 101466]